MAELRKIDPKPFGNRLDLPPADTGDKPQLMWLPIAKLRVDPSYQREIFGRGAKNIRDIASTFRWTHFEAVTVAAVQGGVYAVINGQHRTIGAALRGADEVPCLVVQATKAEQAAAFEAINTKMTAVTPMQLHAARVESGNKAACELDKVCRDAGVIVCRYPVALNKAKPGETMAVGQLARMLRLYGADVLSAALRCITQTRKGNPGWVRAQIISAICSALEGEPAWMANDANLLRAMWKFDYAAQYQAAVKRSADGEGSITSMLLEAVCDHLDEHLEVKAA